VAKGDNLPNAKNLIPQSERSPSEAREMGHKGGKRSGEVRREKAAVSAVYAELLSKTHNVTINGKKSKKTGTALLRAVALDILQKGSSASRVSMLKEIREATEGSKINLGGSLELPDLGKLSADEQDLLFRVLERI